MLRLRIEGSLSRKPAGAGKQPKSRKTSDPLTFLELRRIRATQWNTRKRSCRGVVTGDEVKHQIPSTAYWITAFKKKINAFYRSDGPIRTESQGLTKPFND
jgi:hypothetical protein